MVSKVRNRKLTPLADLANDTVSEAEIDYFLTTHRDEVAAKLEAARKSIGKGDVAPLEPLATLLRAARRTAKPR